VHLLKTKFSQLLAAAIFCFGPYSANAITLGQAYEAMFQHDPEILRSRVGVELSETRVDRSTSDLKPKLTSSISTSRTSRKQFGVKERYQGEDYSIALTQPVYNAPLWIEPDRLSEITRLKQAELDSIKQKRTIDLISTYAQWIEAELRFRAIVKRVELVSRRLAQVDELFIKKRLSVTQVLTVQNEQDRVRAELARAKSQAVTTESALRSLVGTDTPIEINQLKLSVNVWPLSDDLIDEISQVEQNHPLVDQAIAQRAAATLALEQANSKWLPRVDARLQVRHTNVGSNDTETFPTETTSAQLTMSWDLYDSGANEAAQREAELLLRDADLALEQARRDVAQQRESMNVDIERLREGWTAALAEYQSAIELSKAADRSFELGVGTVADSLRALEGVTDAETRLMSRWLESLLGAAQVAQVNNSLSPEVIGRLSRSFQ
jgi:outer membrane protein